MQTKKTFLLPAIALAGGIVGFFLRQRQVFAAYNPMGEFFVDGVPATYILLGVLAVLLLGLALSLRGGHTPEDFLPLMQFRSRPLLILHMVSAAVLCGAGVLQLLHGYQLLEHWKTSPEQAPASLTAATLLCGLLCILAAVSLVSMGMAAHNNQCNGRTSSLACFPAFAGLVWVFSIHLSNGVNPILMDYGFLLAAAILLTLCQYYAAGSFFGHICPRRMIFCGLSGTVLGLTSVADRLQLHRDNFLP